MRQALELASLGLGKVQPNPMVGSVIVHAGKIIGEGYHREYGKEHAEVNAINDVLEKQADAINLLQEATLYVNLEPCSHFGKTPPCSDLIIKMKIPRVVIANLDPFSAVNGKGIEKLRNAGVEVVVSVLEDEGRELNKRFLKYHESQRPYIILKWAESQDGFVSKNHKERTFISGSDAIKLNHRWRTEEQAIMIGTRTAELDNPELTAREWEGKNPVRVVIDKDLRLTSDLKIFNDQAKTIIFNNIKSGIESNLYFIQIDFHGLVPQFILYQLYLMEIQSIIIEGGPHTLKEFIKFDLWDEARILRSNNKFESGLKAPELEAEPNEIIKLTNDTLLIYKK